MSLSDVRAAQAMLDGRLPQFVNEFMAQQYPDRVYPQWTVDALHEAGIELHGAQAAAAAAAAGPTESRPA
jgi:hypothetical protein